MSVADALVAALWNPDPNSEEWPERTIEELLQAATARLGYPISNSTIRSALYATAGTFERTDEGTRAVYRLTKKVRAMRDSRGEQ